MIAIVASSDPYLSDTLTILAREAGFRIIRTSKPERVLHELKQANRLAIIDMACEAFQDRSVLAQLRNVGAILENRIVCICPNQDETLKKLARSARPSQVFLRFDLHVAFKQFLDKFIPSQNEPTRKRA